MTPGGLSDPPRWPACLAFARLANTSRRHVSCASSNDQDEELDRGVLAGDLQEATSSGRGTDMDGSGEDSQDEEGSGQRPPLLVRLVRGVVLTILRQVWGLLSGFARFVRSRKSKWDLAAFVLILLAVAPMLPSKSSSIAATPQEVMYSDFLQLTKKGLVKSARIDEAASQIYFDVNLESKPEQEQPARRRWLPGRKHVAVPEPQEAASVAGTTAAKQETISLYTKQIRDPELIPTLLASGVQFGAIKTTMVGTLTRMLGTVLALWLPLLPLIFIMRQALGGRSNTKAKNKAGKGAKAPVVTFQDVAGVDSAKDELLEVVQCLRDASRYARLNARMPSGVLLCGPPGTGKTLLAKAVAGEAGVPFFAAAASEFVELFVGRGAARVRDLFAEARKRAPCVVFIDELDAVGGRRGIGLNEERDQTLNQLLTELDGFESRTGVLLLAATNRPEVLDAALTRPGRISRKVVVPLPDEAGRAQIMAVHLRNTPMASPLEKFNACRMVARISAGLSGAELANVCNEAALLAGRRSAEVVELRHLVEAVDRTRYGVNGSSGLLPASWRKRFNEWMVDALSNSRQMRTLPTSL